jgi:hypothetical protein
MASWITTKQRLLRQDAKSLHTRNEESDALGHPTGNMDVCWVFAMHHCRCQNVYITTTASERIVDTLDFFPHNYQITQLSSTEILIMAAKDMTDALQNAHPEVPFARNGDDTISALA